MKFADMHTHLAAEFARLRAAAESLDTRVPSCPEWTIDDLVRHVAVVYLHKVACMQQGAAPANWPPDLSAEPALDLLDRAYRQLTAEFAAREPESATHTWYDPDQTVGFWVRRMLHETTIHRYDAELAAGRPTPIAAESALDGVDEALSVVLTWCVEDDEPANLPTIEVRTGGQSWFISPTDKGMSVDRIGTAATTIEGSPSDLLLWLWRRMDDAALTVTRDPAGLTTLRRLMATATQ